MVTTTESTNLAARARGRATELEALGEFNSQAADIIALYRMVAELAEAVAAGPAEFLAGLERGLARGLPEVNEKDKPVR